eukprot:TRINITY_DN834_c0_g1_i2.p1 TRINITY_DN834_c0_g1~~TRINITY_DN834_c0_g1_i2.p1  ORF type:complete len:379 (+),score=77.63 TRINITY_DN834_c0_g1_i2:1074-2210(+)
MLGEVVRSRYFSAESDNNAGKRKGSKQQLHRYQNEQENNANEIPTIAVIGLPGSGRRTFLQSLAAQHQPNPHSCSDRVLEAYRSSIKELVVHDLTLVYSHIEASKAPSTMMTTGGQTVVSASSDETSSPLVPERRFELTEKNYHLQLKDWVNCSEFKSSFDALDAEGGVSYCARWFIFDRLEDLCSKYYLPTDEDVVSLAQGGQNYGDLTEMLFIGQQTRRIVVPRNIFQTPDVKYWLDTTRFQISFITFLVDCSCFDVERNGKNLFEESQEAFQEVLKHKNFLNKGAILVFTKVDLLMQKLDAFKSFFKDFTGNVNNLKHVKEHIQNSFTHQDLDYNVTGRKIRSNFISKADPGVSTVFQQHVIDSDFDFFMYFMLT